MPTNLHLLLKTHQHFPIAPALGERTWFPRKLEAGSFGTLPGSTLCGSGVAVLKRARTAFTLVELLAVLAIVGILLVLANLGFKAGSGAAALTGEGNRIASLVNLARQNAMSKNALTALIVITDPALDVRLKAASLWEATPRNDGSATAPSDWKQISKWEILRTGVVFMPPTDAEMDLPTVAVNPPFPTLNLSGNPVSSDGFVCKIFLPAGGLLTGRPGILHLAEGFLPPGEEVPEYTNKNADGAPANIYTITIIAATGQVVVEQP